MTWLQLLPLQLTLVRDAAIHFYSYNTSTSGRVASTLENDALGSITRINSFHKETSGRTHGLLRGFPLPFSWRTIAGITFLLRPTTQWWILRFAQILKLKFELQNTTCVGFLRAFLGGDLARGRPRFLGFLGLGCGCFLLPGVRLDFERGFSVS